MNITLRHATRDLRLLGDPSRVRILALLAGRELSVAELTQATRLSQSRVSAHLARLKEAGWVRDRRQGPSSFYRISFPAGAPPASWRLMEPALRDPQVQEDARRLAGILRRRGDGSPFPDSIAGGMGRRYAPGRTWEAALHALLGLFRIGRVLDVGCGDGALIQLVAPRAEAAVGIDTNRKVLAAAKRRLAGLPHVALRHGDMHQLPFGDASFDAVLLMNALDCSEDPARALREAARVLRPGGCLAGSALARHRHPEASRPYGHVREGFEPAPLARLLREAGLSVSLCRVTCVEKRPPHFEVVTFHAAKERA